MRCVMMAYVNVWCARWYDGGGELMCDRLCLRAMFDVRALHVVRKFHMAVQYGEHGAYVQRCVQYA